MRVVASWQSSSDLSIATPDTDRSLPCPTSTSLDLAMVHPRAERARCVRARHSAMSTVQCLRYNVYVCYNAVSDPWAISLETAAHLACCAQPLAYT